MEGDTTRPSRRPTVTAAEKAQAREVSLRRITRLFAPHHRSVAGAADPLADAPFQPIDRCVFCPVLGVDVPPHVSVAGCRERSEHPRIAGPVPERASEPRPRIHAARLADRLLGALDVVSNPLVGEVRHARVVVAVTADHVVTD